VWVALILMLARSSCCGASQMVTSTQVQRFFVWAVASASIWAGVEAQHSWGVARSPDTPVTTMHDYDSSDSRSERTHTYGDSGVDASSATSSNNVEFNGSGSRIAHPWGGMDSATNGHVATLDSTTSEASRVEPNLRTENDEDVQGHQRHAWSAPNYRSDSNERPERSREDIDLAQVKKGWNFPPLSEQRRRGKTASEVMAISSHVVRAGSNDNEKEET